MDKLIIKEGQLMWALRGQQEICAKTWMGHKKRDKNKNKNGESN